MTGASRALLSLDGVTQNPGSTSWPTGLPPAQRPAESACDSSFKAPPWPHICYGWWSLENDSPTLSFSPSSVIESKRHEDSCVAFTVLAYLPVWCVPAEL